MIESESSLCDLMTHNGVHETSILALVLLGSLPAAAQVDLQRAATYFKEAAVLCEREGGRLWGVSLCGPMAIFDPLTQTIATSQAAPDAKRPPSFGFANAAMGYAPEHVCLAVHSSR